MKEWRYQVIILALVAIFTFASCSGQKKNIDRAEMDIRGIRMALISYAMNDGRYPTTEQGLQALVTKPTLPPEPPAWAGPYLESDDLIDPWGIKYVYRSPSVEDPERHKYDLYSYGPDRKEGGGDDITIRDIEKLFEQQ